MVGILLLQPGQSRSLSALPFARLPRAGAQKLISPRGVSALSYPHRAAAADIRSCWHDRVRGLLARIAITATIAAPSIWPRPRHAHGHSLRIMAPRRHSYPFSVGLVAAALRAVIFVITRKSGFGDRAMVWQIRIIARRRLFLAHSRAAKNPRRGLCPPLRGRGKSISTFSSDPRCGHR